MIYIIVALLLILILANQSSRDLFITIGIISIRLAIAGLIAITLLTVLLVLMS